MLKTMKNSFARNISNDKINNGIREITIEQQMCSSRVKRQNRRHVLSDTHSRYADVLTNLFATIVHRPDRTRPTIDGNTSLYVELDACDDFQFCNADQRSDWKRTQNYIETTIAIVQRHVGRRHQLKSQLVPREAVPHKVEERTSVATWWLWDTRYIVNKP